MKIINPEIIQTDLGINLVNANSGDTCDDGGCRYSICSYCSGYGWVDPSLPIHTPASVGGTNA